MQQLHSAFELLGMLLADARLMSLMALLTVAACIDYRTYRIPNWLTLSGAVLGMAFNTLAPALLHQGFWWAASGALIGFAVTLPLYLLRVMGAGDVKLITAVGTFVGASGILPAFLCIFATGGAAALLFAWSRKLMKPMLANVRAIVRHAVLSGVSGLTPALELEASRSVGKLPYGVSIALGTGVYVVASQLGYF